MKIPRNEPWQYGLRLQKTSQLISLKTVFANFYVLNVHTRLWFTRSSHQRSEIIFILVRPFVLDCLFELLVATTVVFSRMKNTILCNNNIPRTSSAGFKRWISSEQKDCFKATQNECSSSSFWCLFIVNDANHLLSWERYAKVLCIFSILRVLVVFDIRYSFSTRTTFSK